jgi:uncharacterized protein (TIGR03083 family)
VTATPTEANLAEPDLAALYLDTHQRLAALIAELEPDALDRPVPACPGWRVRDVVAHLTAIPEDVMAGRLTRPPSDDETAAQVARFQGRRIDEMLTLWADLAPGFSEVLASMSVWPAVMDVATHEQDIRGALGQPGARDNEVIRIGSERLIEFWQPPVPVRVIIEDTEFLEGPAGDEAPLVLNTTRFEAFRWRLGRRSRRQLAELDWSADPTPILDHMVVFGPAVLDIHE